MKTDRELLELAGKAAGITPQWRTESALNSKDAPDPIGWNPLLEDGDALRLAVKLHINVRYTWCGMNDEYDGVYAERGGTVVEEQIGWFKDDVLDEKAATRRAIVRAAAYIGEAMP